MNNDLISREALKEVFLSYDYLNMGLYTMSMFDIIKVINNAPTVSDRYDEGYSQGYIDGSTGTDWKGGAE